ncbi:MAG: alpha/beta hydrolase [Rhodobacteraceae bacterium]|nr:alpha/beta hydrolase [Paracoccaceae bacterium]
MRLSASLALLAMAAALLAGCAAWIGVRAGAREEAAAAAFPPIGGFVEVDGRQVHVHVSGEGPDLVLIHGASGNLRDFTFDLVGRLEGNWRVIAVDRPGLGWSDPLAAGGESPAAQAEVLRAAVARLGVRRPVILGHSYGGAVALAWALQAPAEPAALVVLSGATMPWPGELGLLYRLADGWLGETAVVPVVSALAPVDRVETLVARTFAPQRPPAGYGAYIGAGLAVRRATLAANLRQVNALKAHLEAMAPLYPGLALPVEILHGEEDAVVGAALHAEPLAQLIPGARLTLLPGIGHMPHHADPQAVVAAVGRAAARAGLR